MKLSTRMTGSFLIDTNLVIAFLAGEEAAVSGVQAASEIFVPVVVVGELNFGARKSAHIDENLQRVRDFVATVSVLAIDSDSAAVYGRVKSMLRAKGRPIPDNDLWIAATAIQHQLTLATRDTHFDHVDDLSTVRW